MATPLVIVESPAKARTIAGFLAETDGFDPTMVEASVGHVRDLPRNAADVPEANKRSWEILGVDVDDDFKPLYIVSPDKKSRIRELKAKLKSASELYLATDEDREGEAIAWHLLEVLNPPKNMPVKRMVFHEITPQAIQHAIENPRDIDRRLVDAQEARRLLDRIYGYGPLATTARQKVGVGTTVGRVQSIGTRLVVERERERMAFVSASYWDLDGEFSSKASNGTDAGRRFKATLVQVDGSRIASGKDFGPDGNVAKAGVVVLDEAAVTTLATELRAADFAVRSVERKPYRRRPSPPFITSTFQQEAGRKLRLSASMAMRSAQSLYEAGYITYMRTDSTTLSETALNAARNEIRERYGAEYLPDAPRQYAKKVKNAQEAHEAIRPAGDVFRSPDDVARELNNRNDAAVYELIWKRTIASQMTDATGETVTVRLGATTASGRDAEFTTSGTIINHQGFRLAYVVDRDEGDDADEQERQLPPLAEGDALDVHEIEPHGHDTQPPPRYTEASLVKRLEELGVGRPSTYASIINTIKDRGYVKMRGNAMVATFKAFAIVQLLERHFPHLVDYAFTARMEDDLDEIAGGEEALVPWLTEFYFGHAENGELKGGLKNMVAAQIADIDAASINSIPIGCDADGVLIVAKPGRSDSPYLQRGDDTASIPDSLAPDELTVEKALELLAQPKGGRDLGVDPVTGQHIYAKTGRYGPYVQLGEYDDTGKTKPKMASLFQTMTLERLTLDDALELLSLPRVVGVDPSDGIEIMARNGPNGGYLVKELPDGKKDSRNLANEEQILSVTLDEALALFAQPKMRGRAAAKPPLRTMGTDAVSGKPMFVKDGKFGPYVTDGETNASLRKSDDVDTITDERCWELLAERREREPVKKKAAAKKAPAKKAPAKKAAAKKAAAKAPAKKAAAKKAAAKKAAAKAPGTQAAASAGAADPGPSDDDFDRYANDDPF